LAAELRPVQLGELRVLDLKGPTSKGGKREKRGRGEGGRKGEEKGKGGGKGRDLAPQKKILAPPLSPIGYIYVI